LSVRPSVVWPAPRPSSLGALRLQEQRSDKRRKVADGSSSHLLPAAPRLPPPPPPPPASSSSSSSSSSHSAACVSAVAVGCATVFENVDDCIEALRDRMSGAKTENATFLTKLLPKSKFGFWESFRPSIKVLTAKACVEAKARSEVAVASASASASASAAASSSSVSSVHSTHVLRARVMVAAASVVVSGEVAGPLCREPEDGAKRFQNELTKVVEIEARHRLLESADDACDAVRLANVSADGAPLFMSVRPLERCLMLSDEEWRAAKRLQYGVSSLPAANGEVWICKCGKPADAGHNHHCNRVSGPATFTRHQHVLYALKRVAEQECALLVTVNPRTWSDVLAGSEGPRGGEVKRVSLIPDLTVEGSNFIEAVDVSGVFGESPSYLPKFHHSGHSLEDLRTDNKVKERENRKVIHYSKLKESGYRVTPFVFEAHGGLGRCADRFIERIAAYGAEANELGEAGRVSLEGYIRRVVAVAIQRGNGALDRVARSKQRNSWGSREARGLVSSRVDG
jgi:hypothetical protein